MQGIYHFTKPALLLKTEDPRGVRGVPEDASPVQMADEIRRLRNELAKSQRREDILKKAALILGNDPRNDMS